MGQLTGKVALITGVARGQGRSHALRLAADGADIVGMDICADQPDIPYPMASAADLDDTAAEIAKLGRKSLLRVGDIRQSADLEALVRDGVDAFGHIDIVVANAGVASFTPSWEISEDEWQTVIDINLTGAWRTAKTVIPGMIAAGRGGSIMFTSSGAASRANGNLAHYSATKTALTGMAREMALELAPHGIRVNCVQPTAVRTMMMDNPHVLNLFNPDLAGHPIDELREATNATLQSANILPVGWTEPADVSKAVAFLASDESNLITGTSFRVDAGYGSR